MKEVTIIELSELTGVTRSQIYHLVKKDKIMILNGKVNYNNALKVVATLTITKSKRANEKNFRQILNMLVLQNTALQKQLDLASDREKTNISELTSCQPDLPQKSPLIPPIDQSNTWSTFENHKEEKSQAPMQSENDIHAPKESCHCNNTEIKATSIISTPSPLQDDSRQTTTPNIRKKTVKLISTQDLKNLLKKNRNLNPDKQSERMSSNESMTDQDKVYKKDHGD